MNVSRVLEEKIGHTHDGTADAMRQKTAELLGLLDTVWSVPEDGLGAFIRQHLNELPTWKEYLGQEPSNA